MTTKYDPLRGSSYFKLPKNISDSKACINIKNEDRNCFKYSVQCGYHEIYNKLNPERLYHYKNINDNINWENTEDMKLSDIDKFERKNT